MTYKDFPALPGERREKWASASSLSIRFKFYPASTSLSDVGDKTVTLVSHQAVPVPAFWVISLINSTHLITSNWPIKVGGPIVCSNHLWQEETVSPSLSFSLFIHLLSLFTCLKTHISFHLVPQLSFVTPAACGARLKGSGWRGQACSPLPGTRGRVNDRDGPAAATQTRTQRDIAHGDVSTYLRLIRVIMSHCSDLCCHSFGPVLHR